MKYWREAELADAYPIAQAMRPEDVMEVAAFGHDPMGALIQGYGLSVTSYTLLDPTGEPIAMAGVTPTDDENLGAVWLLGTPGIEQYGFRFLRYSKEFLQHLYDESGYECLFNYTHKDNVVHHRWLKWLGFSFIRRVNIGNSGFIEFARLKG